MSDIRIRVDLTSKIVQSICKIAEYYVDRILAQLASDGFCGELQVFLPAALLTMVRFFSYSTKILEDISRKKFLKSSLKSYLTIFLVHQKIIVLFCNK